MATKELKNTFGDVVTLPIAEATAIEALPAAGQQCAIRMRAGGVNDVSTRAFIRTHQLVADGSTGQMPEETLEPAVNLPRLDDMTVAEETSLIKETVVLKLNGGLGTGMGLSKAKSLLEVKDGKTFLDFIAQQVLHFRDAYDCNVRFMLMNSFSTSDDTKAFFAKYPEFSGAVFDNEVQLMQGKVPKIDRETLLPAQHEADPGCEWCPPGHGELYAALAASGKLESLLEEGFKYMFVSNSDNLGATLDLKLLSHLAKEKLPFVMEVCERTESDKKGGHLARDRATGRLILRESAQCPKDDEPAFQDITKHKFFNTNNLWINLAALKAELDAHKGVLPLPVIRNAKTADPTDVGSQKVYQLETAMGSAIASFQGASAVVVPRSRFAPVKTCNDLLALRSDCYDVTADARLVLNAKRNGVPPLVSLEDKHYKFVPQFEQLVKQGVPSMIDCTKLSIKGAAEFAPGVKLVKEVAIQNGGEQRATIEAGEVTGSLTIRAKRDRC